MGDSRPVLITGGSGFIGTNLAHRLLSSGRPVLIFDNLSRAGVEENLRWLQATHGKLLQTETGDVRDAPRISAAVARAGAVFHLAAQVAVTRSLDDPIHDFEINARGTMNVLEALRGRGEPCPLIFTSTNKVYGGLDDIAFVKAGLRYEPSDDVMRKRGVDERRRLDFHSPYGCSKGTADQYVLDYSRSYGIPATVFRMSCIYGPHQFGTEDQGWVAHFLIQAIRRKSITLFGDGCQVRDVLFIDDLVDAFLLAEEKIASITGQAFNIGGGPGNTVSLLELLQLLETLGNHRVQAEIQPWRTGDQKYYVSDVSRFQRATGWSPATGADEGIRKLYSWLLEAQRDR